MQFNSSAQTDYYYWAPHGWSIRNWILACSILAFWDFIIWDHPLSHGEPNSCRTRQSKRSLADPSWRQPERRAARLAPAGTRDGRLHRRCRPVGGSELARKSRESAEDYKLLRTLQLLPTQQVCDFGCGNGYYTLQLARLVGPRRKCMPLISNKKC